MSGSLKYFKYTTGLGDGFAILADESNIEQILVLPSAEDPDLTPADLANFQYKLPGNIKPRYATYKSTTSVRVKRIVIPTETGYNDLVSGAGLIYSRTFTDTETGENFSFVGVTPEKIKPITTDVDTGLQDGDAT